MVNLFTPLRQCYVGVLVVARHHKYTRRCQVWLRSARNNTTSVYATINFTILNTRRHASDNHMVTLMNSHVVSEVEHKYGDMRLVKMVCLPRIVALGVIYVSTLDTIVTTVNALNTRGDGHGITVAAPLDNTCRYVATAPSRLYHMAKSYRYTCSLLVSG